MRNQRLDVLRGIAVVLVLLRHGAIPLRVTAAGWIGVDLFFVLSGFLISGLLFGEYKRRGSIDIKRFIVRRMFKIYPAFYAFLLGTFLLELSNHQLSPLRSYLSELCYLQNYWASIWAHTWSLAVEEHFYLLLPAFLWVLVRSSAGTPDPFRAVPRAFLVVAALCLTARLVAVHGAPEDLRDWLVYRKISTPTHHRIDSLFFGVTLGYLHHFHADRIVETLRSRAARRGLALVAALALAPALLFEPGTRFMLTLGLTLLFVGFGIVLVLALYTTPAFPAAMKPVAALVARGFAAVGVWSYSIYLWHDAHLEMKAAELLHVPLHGPTRVAAYLIVSIVVGVGMAKLVEAPMLHVRERWFPSRQAASPVGGPYPAPASPATPAL